MGRLPVRTLELIERSRHRRDVAANASIAQERPARRKLWIAADRHPAAIFLATLQLVDKIAERTARVEIGEVSRRPGAPSRHFLQEIEAKAAQHLLRRNARDL